MTSSATENRKPQTANPFTGKTLVTGGTGFPGHFMIRYHLYRDCFPLQALGQYLGAVTAGEES